MNITLNQILALVGKLDDTPGEQTARERFRNYLKENVTEIGQIRDYIEECLRMSGDQYNRALQDLVNHLGRFLEFEVVFGRYHGVQGEIGFDGHWKSPTGFHIVAEVKTTEVYPIKTSILMGYINELISAKKIAEPNKIIGLYVIGHVDPEIKQLEKFIIAEKRSDKLRIISLESFLSLAELMNEYDISHEDIMAVILPSGPTVDSVVDLMARLVAEPKEPLVEPTTEVKEEVIEVSNYWLTPVKSDEQQTAEEVIETLVRKEGIYAFGERTPGRRYIKPGDWMCFYATTKGVVAHAKVISVPVKKPHSKVRQPERYPWVFSLDNVQLYLDKPIIIDAEKRRQLDAFHGRDLNKSWAWFVQATRKISAHDFTILTKQEL